jgi:hypothetical protein
MLENMFKRIIAANCAKHKAGVNERLLQFSIAAR